MRGLKILKKIFILFIILNLNFQASAADPNLLAPANLNAGNAAKTENTAEKASPNLSASAVLNANNNANNDENLDKKADSAPAKSQLPDKVSLSANRMRFDSQTGDFLAEGNVIIKAGDLTVRAPQGSGNVERQEVFFKSGINAYGKWQGEKIDLKANNVSLTLNDNPTCRLDGSVKGGYGSTRIDADRVTLVGTGGITGLSKPGRSSQTKFWLVNARNLEDTSKKIAFGAGNIEGVIRRGTLYDLTAKKNVWLRGKPQSKNAEPVSLRGDHAIYSFERGSAVFSGSVSAVQGGRTLKSDSLVYFPDQNRVEAMGGVVSRRDGAVDTDRAEITIDLSRERKSSTKTVTQDNKNNNKNKSAKSAKKTGSKSKSSKKSVKKGSGSKKK